MQAWAGKPLGAGTWQFMLLEGENMLQTIPRQSLGAQGFFGYSPGSLYEGISFGDEHALLPEAFGAERKEFI